MQIHNNINAMIQLEKKLESSAQELAKLPMESGKKQQQNMEQQELSKKTPEIDIAKEMIQQIEIPIAYTANAEVISTQNSLHRTLIDIKA